MEILSSFIIFFLLVANISQAPPSRIMPYIIVQGLLKCSLCLGKILVVDMLMATERVSVRILRIELNSPSEEFQSLLMFLLKGETVSHCYPGFRRIHTFLKRLMSQIAKIHMFLLMPKATGVVLNALEPIWLKFISLLVVLSSIMVFDNFHIGSGDSGKNPTGVVLVQGQFFELLNSIIALVGTKQMISLSKSSEQGH